MVLLGDCVVVPAQRDTGVGVAQAGLHGLRVYPIRKQLRGLRVPELVELESLEAVLLAPDVPPVLEVVDAVPAARVRAAHRGLLGLLDANLGELAGLPFLPHGEM